MNANIKIKGDVGVAVNAEEGAAIHIHLVAEKPDNKADPLNYAVHRLLKTCEQANCQAAMEKISKTLFSNRIFKSLTLEQLTQLQVIADEFNAALQHQAQRTPSRRPSVLGYVITAMRKFLTN
jgi:hypothetical protein